MHLRRSLLFLSPGKVITVNMAIVLLGYSFIWFPWAIVELFRQLLMNNYNI